MSIKGNSDTSPQIVVKSNDKTQVRFDTPTPKGMGFSGKNPEGCLTPERSDQP